jgi:ketosteroid isomerase-like protein
VGDELVAVIHTIARGQGSGIRVENRIAHLWTFRDGKATRFRVYLSRAEALEAAGLSE